MFGAGEESGDASASDTSDTGKAQPRASLGDAIARSVDLGYRVVDEYIRQGQRAAQRFGDRSMGPDAVVGDLRESSDRMAQYASDFLGLWFEFMELTTGNGGRGGEQGGERTAALRRAFTGVGAPPSTQSATAPSAAPTVPPTAPAASVDAAPRPDSARLQLEVQSVHPTEVTLDLRPDATRRALTVHGLRAPEADKPRLIDVDLRPATDTAPARLRVSVPAHQPSGSYSGLIVDEETSTPVGTLTVRVTRADG